MSPNGQGFLLNPDAPESLTRFPQARSVLSGSRTIYISVPELNRNGGHF